MNMSIDVARQVLEASKQRARELRSPVSIAIVDSGGHLVLFERMMAPYGWATGDISIAKATTSVMFNQSTDAVAQWGSGIPGFASSLSEMTHGKFVMAAGGWPIKMNGATVGGIGVSGGNAPGRDDEIARAGLAIVDAMARASQPSQAASEAAAPPVPPIPSSFSAPVQPQPPFRQQTYQPTPSYPAMPLPGNMGLAGSNPSSSLYRPQEQPNNQGYGQSSPSSPSNQLSPSSSQYLSPEQSSNMGSGQISPSSSQYSTPGQPNNQGYGQGGQGGQSSPLNPSEPLYSPTEQPTVSANNPASPIEGNPDTQDQTYSEEQQSFPRYNDNRPGGQS